ncbi:hypothetical protein ABZ568_25880 [Streptomyces olindensis]|uniref:Uncharacterized protein n=1 Tax=Streptomyces olindensis TaxID=358823 RepID=A0ABV2Y0S8_9ACTN
MVPLIEELEAGSRSPAVHGAHSKVSLERVDAVTSLTVHQATAADLAEGHTRALGNREFVSTMSEM